MLLIMASVHSVVLVRSQQSTNQEFSYVSAHQRYDSSMQTHPYAKLSQKRPVSLFDKTYRRTPSRFSNRKEKNVIRKRSSEVDRCRNLEQREQYRRLIEQYRNKSLAETELIFCKPLASSDATTGIRLKPSTPVMIDLTKSFLSSSAKTKKETRKPDTTKGRPDIRFQDDPSNKVQALLPSQLEFYRNENEEETYLKNEASSFTKPVSQSQLSLDHLSQPVSTYLCKNFIPDLVKAHSRHQRERQREIAEYETRARLLRERREAKEDKLFELLESRLKVVEDVIPELSPEMEEVVENSLIAHPSHEVLAERFNISITRGHMSTLSGLKWLNDEIINFYMELIVERSNLKDDLPKAHAMNTFFYPKLVQQGYKSVRRWTKRVDVFSKSLLLFPIHLGVHWTLAVADLRSKEIRYYDSMGGSNDKCLAALKQYLADEHMDKKKAAYDVSEWKTISLPANDIPQQMNGSDCGVFACAFAEFVSRDAALTFTQEHMPLLRRTMVWEIINKGLAR